MGSGRKNQEVDKERKEALRILEILKKEGIDVSRISPRRKNNGKKVFRILKELRVDNIEEIIEKYNLNPEFRIGYRINEMRMSPEVYDGVSKKRIEDLGIKKQETTKKSGVFRNQLEEALYTLEKLQAEGIDIAYIPYRVGSKYTTLKDIDFPNIMKIIKEFGFDPEYPIGHKIALTIAVEYYQNRGDYHFGDKERERVNKLGLFDSVETNIDKTLDVLEKLQKEGIDLTSASKPICDKNGNERGRYLYEIEDPNINAVIEKLELPRYYLITKRIAQAKSSCNKDNVFDEKIKEIRDRLKNLGLLREEEPVDIHQAIELIDELENNGIKSYKIPMHTGTECRWTLMSDIKSKKLINVYEKFNITEDYNIGKAIQAIINVHRNNSYHKELSSEEKQKVSKFYMKREKEKEKTVTKDTIKLIEKLQKEYNIDLTNMTLRPIENGKQRSLLLNDLYLTDEELEKICDEFELDSNFPIGNRIINILGALKGKNKMVIDDEDRRKFEEWGMIERKDKTRINLNSKSRKVALNIDIIKALIEAGASIEELNSSIKINNKYVPITLGMLDIDDTKKQRIKDKFNIDDNFLTRNRIWNLRVSYRRGKLTDEEKQKLEELGIISELDKLESEQEKLKEKLEEVKDLKNKAESARRDTKGKSVGDMNE